MVIWVEQSAKFEAISSIMHGTPQFHPFHQYKIDQEWRVERRKIPRLPRSLDHYSAPHYSDVIWVRWRLKSPASWLFTQPFVQAQIKESIKAPRHWSVWGEKTGDRWIPRSHRWIPRTKASDAEHVSIWWRHLENRKYRCRSWVLLHKMWSDCSPVEMCLMNKMPKCHNRILFQKYLKHISWVISGTSSSKLSCNPRHPSRNISCNHRHHLL